MSKPYEVFETRTGRTVAVAMCKAAAEAMVQRCGGWDYDEAQSGHYVVDMQDRVHGRHDTHQRAQSAASMQNMADDYNAYRVVSIA